MMTPAAKEALAAAIKSRPEGEAWVHHMFTEGMRYAAQICLEKPRAGAGEHDEDSVWFIGEWLAEAIKREIA